MSQLQPPRSRLTAPLVGEPQITPEHTPPPREAAAEAAGEGRRVVSITRDAAAEVLARANTPAARFVRRTFRIKPDQVTRIKNLQVTADAAIGYPKMTMDEMARIALELLLSSEDPVGLIQSLRGTSS